MMASMRDAGLVRVLLHVVPPLIFSLLLCSVEVTVVRSQPTMRFVA